MGLREIAGKQVGSGLVKRVGGPRRGAKLIIARYECAGIGNTYKSSVSRRPRMGTSDRFSKAAAVGCALSQVAWSMTSDASRSRVRL